MLTKSQIKALKYVYRHNNIYLGTLKKKFPNDVDTLLRNNYLSCPRSGTQFDGVYVPVYKDSSKVTLTDTGICEVEQSHWFDVRYLLTQIVVPILVGIVSAVVTAILLRYI